MRWGTLSIVALITLMACQRQESGSTPASNEITSYHVVCDLSDGSGVTGNSMKYRVDAKGQRVTSLYPGNELFGLKSKVENYSKCQVWDVGNWECRYNDDSGSFGFSKGISRSSRAGKNIVFLGVDSKTWQRAHNDLEYSKKVCADNESEVKLIAALGRAP